MWCSARTLRPMSQDCRPSPDQSELLSVRLGSGRSYLIPRALLVRFVLSAPDAALNLIQGAEVPGGSLDPSGLPSELTEKPVRGLVAQ